MLLEKIFYTNHYPKEIKSFVVEFLKRMQDKHKNGTDVTDEVGVFFAKLKDFCRFWNEKSGFSIEQEVGLALLANGIQLDAVNKHLENAVRKLACNNLLTQKRIVKLIEKATIPSSSQPNPDATPVEDLASAMVHENNTQVKIFREVYNEHAPLAFFKTTFGRGEFYKGLNAERVENKIRDIEDIADHVVENPDGTGGVAVRALASSDRQDKTIWENMLAPGR